MIQTPAFWRNGTELVRKVYELARPYGRKKLAAVTGVSLLQGLFQMLGVTSIFPFLALAADPARLRNSNYGRKFLELLPPMDDGRLLVVAGLFAIAMLVLSNAMNFFAEYARNRYGYGFAHWLRTGLLRKIVSQPYGYFLQANNAVLIKKVGSDALLYSQGLLLPLLDSFARVVTVLFLLAALFLVQPEIALACTVVLGGFYLLLFGKLKGWRRGVSEKFKSASRGLWAECRKLLDGIKPVKVHGVEEELLGQFSSYSLLQARAAEQVPMASSTPRYLIEPVALGALVAVVLVYATRGMDLLAILPNLGVIALVSYRLLPTFQLLYGQMTQLTSNRHALEEVYEELRAAEKAMEKESGPRRAGHFPRANPLKWEKEIRLEKVGFGYPGAKRPVIEGLDLVIPKNSSLGIVGETGSGKSTFVDLLLGLHTPTAGRILVDGVPLEAENLRAWRAGIGYVPQDIFLIDESIIANIAFGLPEKEIDPAAVRAAAEAAQIRSFIEKDLPRGFETKVGERGVRLSGGQRQRIGLARALYHRPELLILDEATSALDNATEAEVMKAINKLRGKITLIIVAHRLSTVKGCRLRISLNKAVSKENLLHLKEE